jgi:pyruvate kinase
MASRLPATPYRGTRRTKIIATIGPASNSEETLQALIEAGMDVARLNFSHGTPDQHARTAERIRRAAERSGCEVAILQDLPGPKMRIGPIHDDVAELTTGEQVVIHQTRDEAPEASGGDGAPLHLACSADGLAESVAEGDSIYLADGAVRLRVREARPARGEVDTVVEIGGTIASRQGINVPGSTHAMQALPERDLEYLRFGESIGVDLVAISFVRSAADVEELRQHTSVPLIAKIEKPQAALAIEEIAHASDVIMVARGDLGIELPLEDVPVVQKQVIAAAGRQARPVITATQMLDSMVSSSRPTRAEATDVANAILDGTDAVMLSQETAVGAYPVKAVETMAAIAARAESIAPYGDWNEERVHRDTRDPAYTMAYAACAAVRQLDLAALIVPTLSGRSARLVSAHRPQVPVFALSPQLEVVRRCAAMWGVTAGLTEHQETTEALLAASVEAALDAGWVEKGHRVGLTAGLPSEQGQTNLLQIHEV